MNEETYILAAIEISIFVESRFFLNNYFYFDIQERFCKSNKFWREII